jgi:hypothetical protein
MASSCNVLEHFFHKTWGVPSCRSFFGCGGGEQEWPPLQQSGRVGAAWLAPRHLGASPAPYVAHTSQYGADPVPGELLEPTITLVQGSLIEWHC